MGLAIPAASNNAVSVANPLAGDGSSGNPLSVQLGAALDLSAGAAAVQVDGVTIDVNGSNQLEALGGGVLVASSPVVLTDADIKALPSTSITLVAAKGSGFFPMPVMAICKADFAGGAYSGGAGDYITIGTDVDQEEILTPFAPGFTGIRTLVCIPSQLTGLISGSPDLLTPQSLNRANLSNAALTISASAGGDFSGGNASNTLTVVVYYVTIAV